MNYDDEIDKIINSIEKKEYKSFKEIEYNKIIVIDSIYSNYLNYAINKKNKKEALKELEDYEYVELEDLNKGDYIRYFDLRAFYNLKLVNGGKIIDLNIDNEDSLLIRRGVYSISIKPNLFFRKIPDDILVKMKLIQMIED